jgi:hypothetical protein
MTARKKQKTSRGKRYTPEEKAVVLTYIEEVNLQQGRGGQTAATKKFKISPLTISHWLRQSASPSLAKAKGGSHSSTSAKLGKLIELHAQIAEKEKNLAVLRQQFDKLKASI